MDKYTMEIENKNTNTETNNLLPETPFIFEVKATEQKCIMLYQKYENYYCCFDIEKGNGYGKFDEKLIIDAIKGGNWILQKSKLIIG